MSFENYKQEDNKIARTLDYRFEKLRKEKEIKDLEIQIQAYEYAICKAKKRIEELSK